MEVAAFGFWEGTCDSRVPELFGDQMDDAALDLQTAGDSEEGAGAGDERELIVDLGPDDDVQDAALVFQGHEHHAGRSAWTLPADDQARVADALAVAQRRHVDGRRQALGAELLAQVLERMSARAVGGDLVIPKNGVERVQAGQRGLFVVVRERQWIFVGLGEPADVPERVAAATAERLQRSGLRQGIERIASKLRAAREVLEVDEGSRGHDALAFLRREALHVTQSHP